MSTKNRRQRLKWSDPTPIRSRSEWGRYYTSHCLRKVPYGNQRHAQEGVLYILNKYGDAGAMEYSCHICGKWRIGHI